MSQSPSHNPDKLDEAIATDELGEAPEERDFEAEEAERIAKACLSTRDRTQFLIASAVPGSLRALFATVLLQGIPEGMDEDEVSILMDSIEGGETDGECFLAMARRIHFVEICLPNLRADFESGRFPRPKELTFEKIETALFAKRAEGLLKAAKLDSAQFFEVDEAGNLVLSDGTDEVPASTLRQNHFTVRKETHAAGLELFKRAEYERFLLLGKRRYERLRSTWLENGGNPFDSMHAHSGYVNEYACVFGFEVLRDPDAIGARRLARVPLKLKGQK